MHLISKRPLAVAVMAALFGATSVIAQEVDKTEKKKEDNVVPNCTHHSYIKNTCIYEFRMGVSFYLNKNINLKVNNFNYKGWVNYE